MSDLDFFCKRPWTGFEIEHDGSVKPCCMTRETSCGNVNTSSVEEIWNGAQFRRLRELMASGQADKICKPDCPRFHSDFEDATPFPQSSAFTQNFELNETEIREKLTVLRSKPRFWKLAHSTRCNIDCIMCYQDRSDMRELPEKFYQDLLDYQPAIQEIQLVGGETLAIKRFRQFLKFFAESTEYPDMRFAFVTNGTVHDDNTLDMIGKLQVSWISISVDAATFPTYAIIRRGGNFLDTCKGIERLTDLGRRRGIPVLISFTVMKDNVNETADFVRLARNYGVDAIFGKILGTKGGQHLIDPDIMEASLKEAIAVASPYGEEMRIATITLRSLLATIQK